MIPSSLMRQSVIFCTQFGKVQAYETTAKITIASIPTKWTRPWSSCPCSCGAQQQVNGLRKSPKIPNLSQSSSISTSCALNAGLVDERGTTGSRGQWDLFAGIVLERKPQLTAKKNEIEQKYADFLAKLEFENSKKSDHEIRIDNDMRMMEKAKSGDVDLVYVQTAKDDEDRWNTEAQKFQPASRETEADRKNDTRSLDRALDSHLLLVVNQKLGKDYRWICPHSKLQEGESLRQAAERMLRASFPELKAKVLGNAPWGFYKYKYPKSESSSSAIGAKVFFYKAQVLSGNPKKSSAEEIKDFSWLKRNELSSKLQPEYYKKLSECLIDEYSV